MDYSIHSQNKFQEQIPGFVLSTSGLFEEAKNGKQEYISAPIWVSAISKGVHWGRVFKFIDHDGQSVEVSSPASRLYEGISLVSELANAGLRIAPGKERRLISYLAYAEPSERVIWNDDNEESEGTEKRIIEAVKAFIIKNSARFQGMDSSTVPPNRAGFYDPNKGWFFSKDALSEAADEDPTKIAKILNLYGFLFTNDSKLMAVVKTHLGRGRWYVIKPSMMSESMESESTNVAYESYVREASEWLAEVEP
ncbi:MAG: DUF927 domain-containing protein [Halothiobacillaceae bacterium]|nr:DUF927 domain-containing protein [Halothiobacillaceae bacterium]